MNRTSLVIGGGGFIGNSLVKLLANSGRKVIVLGRSSNSKFDGLENVRYVQGSFCSRSLIESLLDESSEVIHMAYATVPNTSFDDPLGDLNQNLPPTLQLFSLAAKKNIKVILLSSGGTVYGQSKNLPLTENHSTHPISPYGVTKLTIENYAHLFSVTHGLKYICLRPSNAYGVGQKPFSGQGFISTAVGSIIKNNPIVVYGEIGTVRDYVYVDDLARGILLALENGNLYETYNIGSGIGFSNIEVIETLNPIMLRRGYSVEILHSAERIFDVRENILDSSKFYNHTGWTPKVNFEKGLEIFVDWAVSEFIQ